MNQKCLRCLGPCNQSSKVGDIKFKAFDEREREVPLALPYSPS